MGEAEGSAEQSRAWRPKSLGPRRRWLLFVLWVGLHVTVVATQISTAYSFEHGTLNTGPTHAERLWYKLPLLAICLTSTVFLVGLHWWAPEKDTRLMLRVSGVYLTVVSVLVTLSISWWYNALFYID